MKLDSRLIRLARSQQILILLSVSMGLGVGILTVLQARLLSQVIGQVFLKNANLHAVWGGLILVLGLLVLRAVCTWVNEYTARLASVRIQHTLRQRLFEHILALGPIYARGERTGELVNTATEGIAALEAYFSQYLPQVALAALVPLTFLLLIFPLDPLSGVVLLLTAPLIPLFMLLIGNLSEAVTRRQWKVLSQMSAFYLDLLQGLTTLKTLGRSQEQATTIHQVDERYRQVTLKVLRVTFLSALSLELLSTLSTAVIAVEIGLRLLYGRLSFEHSLFILFLAPEFYLPLRQLGTRFHAGMAGVAAAQRIFAIFEQPFQPASQPEPAPSDSDPSILPIQHSPGTPTRPSSTSAGEVQATPSIAPPAITFENVSFAYEPNRPALQYVSFQIPSGKKVALVGKSGSGKSTLTNLLLKLISPAQGRILVNGLPLEALPVKTWRQQLAWVPQLPYLFYGTVEENIRLSRPNATHEQVVKAARLAHADEFIQALPQGYDTQIGERGTRLSAGQAQRLALARAFLRDAPLLIFDEPGANLDPITQSLIQDSLRKLLPGRTALIIAHQLETIMDCDWVIVLDEGRVLEQGTPESVRFLSQVTYTQKTDLRATDIPLEVLDDIPPNRLKPRLQRDQRELKKGELPGWLLRPLAQLKRHIFLSIFLGLLTVLSGVGLMSTSAYIISAAALSPSIAELQVAIVGVRFFGIARGVLRYLERLVSHGVTFRLLGALRLDFYRALEPLAPARLLQYRSGDLFNRIARDLHQLEDFYVRSFAPLLVAALTALITAGSLAVYHWHFSLATIALMLFTGVVLPWIVRLLSQKPGRKLVRTQAALSSVIVDGIQGSADLTVFGATSRQSALVNEIGTQLFQQQTCLAKIFASQACLAGLSSQLAGVLVLILAIPLVDQGALPGVLLATLMLFALTSFEAILPLPHAAQLLESDLAAAYRLREVIVSNPEISEPAQPLPLPGRFDLEVQNLYFAYPDEDEASSPPAWVLQDISFSLPMGGKLAIVGASGAGKTTLLNLLLRFFEYKQGEILLGGNNLHQYSPASWRTLLGVVSQPTHLFNATIRENLLIASPKASPVELDAAIEAAQLRPWLTSLPQGYDTPLGELGMRISGGERQRIALARALLKNPPILLLDEPTVHLDPFTESRVLETLFQMKKSILLITHRIVGLEHMDEILVLHQGRVIERGTHQSLLDQRGYYWRMAQLQAYRL